MITNGTGSQKRPLNHSQDNDDLNHPMSNNVLAIALPKRDHGGCC